MGKIATILILAMSMPLATAQQELSAGGAIEDEIRRYKVEVIVFTYEEDVSIGSEVFLPDEPPVVADPLLDEDGYPIDIDAQALAENPATADEEVELPPAWVVDYGTDDGEQPGDTDIGDGHDLRIHLLAEDEFELAQVIRQFELLDAYRTILHTGWIQPTYPDEETPAVELRLLAEPPQGLDGSFTLYLSRYLHLVVDLALDAQTPIEEPPMYEPPALSYGDSRAQYEDAYGIKPQPVRYRIQDNRIVKNGELRYFDHPKFGVLAKISRVEEEQAVVPIPLIGAGRQ